MPHIYNENDAVNPCEEAQETVEENVLGQGHSNDMYFSEVDTLANNSFETSDIEMSPDETYKNLDLQDKLDITEVEKIRSLYEGVEDKTIPVSSVTESQELLRLQNCLVKYKALLAEKSPTAKLWLQYIEYIETLKLFIRAKILPEGRALSEHV